MNTTQSWCIDTVTGWGSPFVLVQADPLPQPSPVSAVRLIPTLGVTKTTMFTYICFGSNNLARSARFYDAVLGEIGLTRCDTSEETDWDQWIGWGTYEDSGLKEMALWICQPQNGAPATAGNGTMVALKAENWNQVQRAHQAALESGGTSEGPPGLRPHYNPDFYAAYVCDPDGNKLAFVCRGFTTDTAAASAARSR